MLMIKQLLSVAVVAAASLTASATTIKVWEGSQALATWSDKVLVEATNFAAVAEGCQIVVHVTPDMTLDTSITYTNLGAKTNTDGWPQLDGCGWQNPTDIATWDINAAAAGQLKATGLILQGQNLVVNQVDLVTAEDVDPNLMWEGEFTIANWNASAAVSASKLKAGDALKYTFSSPGTSSAQVLAKNSSWANLLGTAKGTSNDLATGELVVGMTEASIADMGEKTFLQGDGDVVLTKIELMPAAFAAEGVLAWGDRKPGCSYFITIPEGTTSIDIVMTGTPSWFQVCNSSWTSLVDNGSATTATNADGTITMTFPLTAENIAAINEKKELVTNGDGAVTVKSIAITGTQTGINSVIAPAEAAVEYYNLNGQRVANPQNGLFIKKQGNTVTKVIVK